MIIGSLILIFVHSILTIPIFNAWWLAAAVVIILGMGFSLVPAAMWPSVPKIIPEKTAWNSICCNFLDSKYWIMDNSTFTRNNS